MPRLIIAILAGTAASGRVETAGAGSGLSTVQIMGRLGSGPRA